MEQGGAAAAAAAAGKAREAVARSTPWPTWRWKAISSGRSAIRDESLQVGLTNTCAALGPPVEVVEDQDNKSR